MTCFDEVAEKEGDDEWEKWRAQVLDATDEIAQFVATYRPGGGAEYVDCHQGSFNLVLQIRFDDGPDAVIRFPAPGHSVFGDEKVENEVNVINFLRENTTIPIPRLLGWGLAKNNPLGFGPFTISEFHKGARLCDLLADPSNRYKPYLNPNISNDVLDKIFDQFADFMLQIYQFDFSRCGSISKHSSGSWDVTGRPLTYTMNELATSSYFPVQNFPTGSFASSRDYFDYLMKECLIHLKTQRNLAWNQDEAEELYVARHLYTKLLDKFCIDDGKFKLFCDDFRPQNMLVDMETHKVTAVFDFEFTNALPSQYAHDPPWWLLLVGPEMYVHRGKTMEQYVAAYEPRLEQFLQAMRRAEQARAMSFAGQRALSDLMRESWDSRRFWFNYAARRSLDIEEIFNTRLNDVGANVDSLDAETRSGIEDFVKMKMEQLSEYKKDCERLGIE